MNIFCGNVRNGEKVTDMKPYNYTDCGLNGIVLLNGFEREIFDGEEYVAVDDVEGLHVAIGCHLVLSGKRFSGAEVKFLRRTMDMTQVELSGYLGNEAQTVARWEKDEVSIPVPEGKLLGCFYLIHTLPKEMLAELKQLMEDIETNINEPQDIESVARFQHNHSWTESALEPVVAYG